MPWLNSATYAELLAKAARVDALMAEIERLRLDLDRERTERIDLTNRLLEKNQVRPLSEPMPAPRPSGPTFDIISPFQSLDAETEKLARDAWIDDLAQGYVEEGGVDSNTARIMAEQVFTRQHQPLN